ncbi:MAG: hypothetical protein Q7S82_00110, partial [bacterium]|nr:hypothetical protein [bacterium]
IARRGFYPKKRVGLGHYTPRFQLTISRFARFILAYYGIPVRHKMKELARKGGLSHDAGGHSDDTVGLMVETLEAKAKRKETCHGVVELFPFNCLPQIVAANVIMKLKGGVPWLRLGCDEQTGSIGVLTRLEAFLDLLETNERKLKIESREAGLDNRCF